MKSGLALAISLIEIKSRYIKSRYHSPAATAGEEVTSNGAALLHEKGYMDDVEALLMLSLHKMVLFILKGTMDIQVISKGKSAHSSMPELGLMLLIHSLILFTI